MAKCEYSSSCSFLNKSLDDLSPASEYLKEKYCNGQFDDCARFRLSKSVGIENVSDNLSPVTFKSPKCFFGI
jgi:hypothetical protein